MGKLKPLATLENEVITVDLDKMRKIIKKYEEPKPIEDWLHTQLSNVLSRYPTGHFLVFARLNPLGAKVFLSTEVELGKIEIIRITGWYDTFRGKKWKKSRY